MHLLDRFRPPKILYNILCNSTTFLGQDDEEICLLRKTHTAFGTVRSHTEWLPGGLSTGVQQTGIETCPLLSVSSANENVWKCASTSSYAFMRVKTVHFTFT